MSNKLGSSKNGKERSLDPVGSSGPTRKQGSSNDLESSSGRSLLDLCLENDALTAEAIIKNLVRPRGKECGSLQEEEEEDDDEEEDSNIADQSAASTETAEHSSVHEKTPRPSLLKYAWILIPVIVLCFVFLGMFGTGSDRQPQESVSVLPKDSGPASSPDQPNDAAIPKAPSEEKSDTAATPKHTPAEKNEQATNTSAFTSAGALPETKVEVTEIEARPIDLQSEKKEAADIEIPINQTQEPIAEAQTDLDTTERANRIRKAQERIAKAQAELNNLNLASSANDRNSSPSKNQLRLNSNRPEDIESFLESLLYYRSNGFSYALSDVYAPKANFRAYGIVSKTYIREYFDRENKQWQQQDYKLHGDPIIRPSRKGELAIEYKTKYARTPTGGGREIVGVETLGLILKVSDDGVVQIIGEFKK